MSTKDGNTYPAPAKPAPAKTGKETKASEKVEENASDS
jgi:hypothetical protein